MQSYCLLNSKVYSINTVIENMAMK